MRASGVTTARLRGWPGLAGDDGIRARDGDTIIRVHGQPAGMQFGGVQACRFGRDRRPLPVGRAGRASVGKEYLWTPGHDARTRSGDADGECGGAAHRRDRVAGLRRARGRRRRCDGPARPRCLRRPPAEPPPRRRTGRDRVPVARRARRVIGIRIGAEVLLRGQTLNSGRQLLKVARWLVDWPPTAPRARFSGVRLWHTR
jgi:hypothetical protein